MEKRLRSKENDDGQKECDGQAERGRGGERGRTMNYKGVERHVRAGAS